jgi:hypothetical protein
MQETSASLVCVSPSGEKHKIVTSRLTFLEATRVSGVIDPETATPTPYGIYRMAWIGLRKSLGDAAPSWEEFGDLWDIEEPADDAAGEPAAL